MPLFLKRLLLKLYEKLRVSINRFSYSIYKHQRTFDVMTAEETVMKIVGNRELSVARFGDGEYHVIEGGSTGFQQRDLRLGKKLREVLNSCDNKCLVCIPRPFVCTSHLAPKSKKFWTNYLGMKRKLVLRLTPPNSCFGDACFSRFYFENKPYNIEDFIHLIKKIWDKRSVFVVEGTNTKFGVGNDLLDNAKEVKRILCPTQNAYDKYDAIYNSVLNNVPEGSLILIALGMTATVLAYDLSQANRRYQAIDIGHLDIEYECYLRNSNGIIAIPGKAVNEVGNNNPEEELTDFAYKSSIIAKII